MDFDYVVHMKSPWRPCDEFQSQLHSSNTELTIDYHCAHKLCVNERVRARVSPTA